MIGATATREIRGQQQVIHRWWFHGTDLETTKSYGWSEWKPHPGCFLTDSLSAAWCYATLNRNHHPVLVRVRIAEWLLWSTYRADIDPVDLAGDHGIVGHLRSTLGPESANDDAVIMTDGIPGVPGAEILAMLILSEDAANDIQVVSHETCPPDMIDAVDRWSDSLGEMSIAEILDEIAASD